jgi:hypothetical protein
MTLVPLYFVDELGASAATANTVLTVMLVAGALARWRGPAGRPLRPVDRASRLARRAQPADRRPAGRQRGRGHRRAGRHLPEGRMPLGAGSRRATAEAQPAHSGL